MLNLMVRENKQGIAPHRIWVIFAPPSAQYELDIVMLRVGEDCLTKMLAC